MRILIFWRSLGLGAKTSENNTLSQGLEQSTPIENKGVSAPRPKPSPPPEKQTAAPAGHRNGGKIIEKASNLHCNEYRSRPLDAIAELPSVTNDVLWLRRELIAECGDSIASLGMSLAEAAWRGSDATAEVTLRQIIAATRTACATFREIRPASNEGGAR